MEKGKEFEDVRVVRESPVTVSVQNEGIEGLDNSETLGHATHFEVPVPVPSYGRSNTDGADVTKQLECGNESDLIKTDISDDSAIPVSRESHGTKTSDNVASTSALTSAGPPDHGSDHLSPSVGVEKALVSSDSSRNTQADEMKNVHHIKWIEWSDGRSPIVTQNENGPCPLLAIFNVLLLSKRIFLGEGAEFISSSQILSRVAEIIWDAMPDDLHDDERLNYEQNISDAIEVFPNLQTGLDVNIKFDGVKSFEYTPELAVFDLLRIPLYHGWLVDPQDFNTNEILCGLSYNQAVERVINCSSSENPDNVRKGLIAQEFLESTASQITYHGIVSLREEIQPGSLAVLFRNNHFCTILRHNQELFTLITDLGFLKESDVVWESLCSVQGDSQFVDGKFRNSPPKSATTPAQEASATPNTDLDYQLALSMQHTQQESTLPQRDVTPEHDLSDFVLAQRLQEQENIAAQQAQSLRHPRPSGNTDGRQRPKNDKDDKCNIL